MTAPQRVQRSRAKGWRAPPGTVYVGRPTRWGNPWHVRGHTDGTYVVWRHSDDGRHSDVVGRYPTLAEAHARAVELHARWLDLPPAGTDRPTLDDIRANLAGHHLACWCPPHLPCHADTLLELANEGTDR